MSHHTPRQEELLDIALDLARDSGIAGLTVRNLASRAGFTEAALYRHFPSKQALLVALMGWIERRFLPEAQAIAADRNRPVRERLVDVMGLHVRTVLEIDGLPILLLAEASSTSDRTLQERIRATVGGYLAVLEDLLAEVPEAQRHGRTPGELALVLLGLSAATAIRHRLLPDPRLERTAAEELPALLVDRLTRTDTTEDPT